MALPSVDDIVEIVINGEFDGTEDVKNVYNFQVVGESWVSEADFISDLRELVLTILAVIDGICTIKQLWDSVTWRNISTASPATTVQLLSTVPGTVTGDACPAGTSVLAVWRTATKNVILKKYFGVPAAADLDADGQWDSNIVTTVAGLVTTMLSNMVMTKSTWRFGYYKPSTATFILPVSGYATAEPAYQRRRRRGRGS